MSKVAPRVPHIEPGFGQTEFATEYSVQSGRFPIEFQPILRFLADRIPSGAPVNVLEVGPGPGWMAILLAQAHPNVRVTGIDCSPAFVELAKENARQAGLADRIEFVVGDATQMTFADGQFDVVVSNQSLHYWDPPERVFDEIARVLRPGGVFCIGDDRRDLTWRGRFEVFWARIFLSRRIGASWGHSLAGSLTPAETAAALDRSKLRGRGHIDVYPRKMLITSGPKM